MFAFAIVKDCEIVGAVSLYQLSESVVSCDLEIYEYYRKQGIGSEAMILAMDKAKKMGYDSISAD